MDALLKLTFFRYLICLTIAPAFLSAGIYLCLSRIIVIYGEGFARFKPKTYTIIFICSDIFALVLQAIGGALADTADSGSSLQQTGINIMIAGLSFQVVSLTIFIALCLDFAWNVYSKRATSRPALRAIKTSTFYFRGFMLGKRIANAKDCRVRRLLADSSSSRYRHHHYLCAVMLSCRRIEERV